MRNKIILILIIILAAFLRFYQLDKVPPGFHIDEVIVGYNAHSILETGRDENGNFLPLYIDSFGDFPPAGYFYLTIPSIKVFGLNDFAVRFPHAFVGVLTIILLFFLTRKLFKNNFIALLSSFLLAVSPWHLMMARATSEGSSTLFLLMAGTYLFLSGVEKKTKWYFISSFATFFLSFYFYPAARVFVPLLTFVLVVLNWTDIQKVKLKGVVLGFLVACVISAALVVFIGSGTGRFNQVGILSQPGIQLRLDEQIREEYPGTNNLLVRVFHNKLVNYGFEVLSNYGKHFSFDFLFAKGGLPIRYMVPEAGLLYLIELPFLLIGIFYALKNKNKLYLLPIFWLLIAPVAASLTFEDIPNVRRAFFMLPAFQILTAYGFYIGWGIAKEKGVIAKNLLIFLSILILAFNLGYFLHQYFVHQRAYRPWYRNYGFKELISAINQLSPNYQKIVLTKDPVDPYIYILFYNNYDPLIYQRQYARFRSNKGWGFEKYFFYPAKCPSQFKEQVLSGDKILFVDSGECEAKPYVKVLQIVYREDKTPAFQIVTVDKNLAADYFKKQEKVQN